MSAAQLLLDELRALGIEVVARRGEIRYRPRERITPELRERIAANKPELLALLSDEFLARVVATFSGTVVEGDFRATAPLIGEPLRHGPGTACRACRSTTWWRVKPAGDWICARCHPSQPHPSRIERRDASDSSGDLSSLGGDRHA